mmetsp:Transcript_36398/g.69832  ORF Transcript_36398/g.69832 Transcript_36398/m.69832 type:complete len:240 (+) Transcript_36398:7369-8088(+)
MTEVLNVSCTYTKYSLGTEIDTLVFALEPRDINAVWSFIKSRATEGYEGLFPMTHQSGGRLTATVDKVIRSSWDMRTIDVSSSYAVYMYFLMRSGVNKTVRTLHKAGSTRGLVFYQSDRPWVKNGENVFVGASGNTGLALDIYAGSDIRDSSLGFVGLFNDDRFLRHRHYRMRQDPLTWNNLDFAFKIQRNSAGQYAFNNPFRIYTYYIATNAGEVYMTTTQTWWTCNKFIDQRYVEDV